MKGARSHEEMVVWRLAYELKLGIYALIATGPIRRDRELFDQLQRSAASAPRLIAEGFGRYLPGEFARYLRNANGEFKELYDALRDAVDRGYVSQDQIVPLQRLSRRASKAAGSLIRYLNSATPPHEPRRRPEAPRTDRRTCAPQPPEPAERSEPLNPTLEPPEPPEPPEPDS